MSRARILRIALAFIAFAALLAIGLARLSLVDHDEWVERSLRNRWAFRDVPTRRGSILDAQGVPLAFDVPGFDLELRYATFRRGHPLGACVHGGNLLRRARGLEAIWNLREPERASGALAELLELPLADLRGNAHWQGAATLDPPIDDIARDLRYYVGTIVASLTGAPRARFAVALAAEVRGGGAGSVGDAVARIAAAGRVQGFPATYARAGNGVEVGLVLRDELEQRISELRTLDARLRVARADRDGFDLFAFLEDRRSAQIDAARLAELAPEEIDALEDADFWSFLRDSGTDWRSWPDWRGWLQLPVAQRVDSIRGFDAERARRIEQREDLLVDPKATIAPLFAPLPEGWKAPRFEDEERPRRVLARLPHELASWLAMLAERHPGFVLRASVLRANGRLPGRDDLGSLGVVVGRVGSYDVRGRTPEQDAAERLAAEADFARRTDDSLAGVELSDAVEDSLRQRAEAALRAHFGRLGRIGRSGVEAACGDLLAGQPGLRFVERDKQARELRMFESLDVAPGEDVTLTLDAELQVLAEDALGEIEPGREKAFVVIDAQSGDVLAVVARSWRSEAAQPGFGVGAWAPSFTAYVGSVAKPLVALGFLDALRSDPSLASPDSFPACGGMHDPYDRARHLRCGESHGAGSRDTVHAIAESCNVYFFRVADEIGAERLRACFARFGWDPGAGPEPSPATPRDVPGLPRRMWRTPSLAGDGFQVPMRAIGYGLNVWPLFVARAYAGIATGKLPDLRFVRGEPPRRLALPFQTSDFRTVRDGLLSCVQDGTARAIRGTAERVARESGCGLYGKTGTAEVTTDHRLNNAWFAGFVGEDADARIAFAAVEYRTDDHGGTSAAPIVARFLDAVLDRPALRERVLAKRGRR